MKRRADFPLTKHTLNLFEGDWEKLEKWHPEIGPSRIIRDLIRAHLRKLEKAQAPLPGVDLEIGEVK